MKEILITGGCGFLGSNLALHFAHRYKVIILDQNSAKQARFKSLSGNPNIEITDSGQVSPGSIFDGRRFEAIIHTATRYGRNTESLASIIETNILLPARLIDLAIGSGVPLFINTDSFFTKNTYLKNDYLEAYTLSKRQFTDWMRLQPADIKMVNIRLEHMYGPSDNPDKFVMNILRRLFQNEPGIELTEGDQRRDFIYIDDVVSAFDAIVTSPERIEKGFSTFEAGLGDSVTVRHFAELMKEYSGSSSQLKFGALPSRPNELKDSRANNGGLKALGWVPQYSVTKGIKAMIHLEKQKKYD